VLNLFMALGFLAAVAGAVSFVPSRMPGRAAEPPRPEELRSELASLSQNLERLRTGLGETRGIETRARRLAGLEPQFEEALGEGRPRIDLTGISDPELAAVLWSSSLHATESLREARALKNSFSEIVARMESRSDHWSRVPSVGPLPRARMTSGFGMRPDPFTGEYTFHVGIDLGADVGTPIHVTADGQVTRAGYYRGYGYMVEVDHGNGLVTRYAHNSRNAVLPGQRVTRGQLVAFVGRSGRANASHLHYEVRLHGRPVNPEPYLLSGHNPGPALAQVR
jgi:murein DD-endopeptidase MepM/ murein hydrolase activator NlpD